MKKLLCNSYKHENFCFDGNQASNFQNMLIASCLAFCCGLSFGIGIMIALG